ncbi:hypothetical protein [Pseudonocardia acaciae]|uniref:hypothetical protein n=1 Tax=Pseudonocardia acaciae TaxID=551276 RepID=UPI0012EE677F|nr:hypothetical protein [Pseudonocardia acaciae]
MSSKRRRQVFDPNRLGDIDDLLPPPVVEPATPPPAEPAEVAEPEEQAAPAPVTPAARPAPEAERRPVVDRIKETPPARQPKGQGGRPPGRSVAERTVAEQGSGARVAVAVRISPSLYNEVNTNLLSRPERPSYGQLVLWTCEDYPDDVVTEVREARPQPGARRPRGHTLASEGVQITLRMTTEERDFLDGIADQARPDPNAKRVTRTEVATAALRLALARPPE